MSYNTAQPYLACFVILRRNGKIAFVLRSGTEWMNDYYGLPSGKVEVGEPVVSGAAREVKEEVGIEINQDSLRLVHVTHRKSNDDTLAWIDMFFEVDSWTGEPFNAEPDKHSELAWLDPNNLPENIVPAVRFSLTKLAAGHALSQFGWDQDEK